MQIANALNNTIRILFNPRVEIFRLFDFLIVKSNDERYLAQIIEIYDDKFDASQNVAKLKLFYKITQTNEVMAYDNFTPNKECEIVKINQEEIENFINQDKKTFVFATNIKNKSPLNIQFDFFNKNSIILADKIENTCTIAPNLAKNLSTEKPVVIIDSTGVIEYEDAKKIKAAKNFRLPLNDTTIDYIFENCLNDASLEFQAIGGEIINEIKKFAKKQEQGFIPFNAFTRVILEQYKATPYAELRLLLMRLKKLQMDEIFAKTKKDKETLFKTIEKSPVTIFDISTLNSIWQKAYIEYFVHELKSDAYVITRVNDENFDVDLINKIYNEKRNIKFIPNASYAYKKLPSIMQYCKNYILMPSLYQRMDFLDANFALSNLISDGCILFGENTDNFLYLAGDYGLEVQEKRKNYRKIALSLVQNEKNNEETKDSLYETKFDETLDSAFNAVLEKQNEAPEKNDNLTDSQRLIDELSDFEVQQKQQSDEFEEIEDAHSAKAQKEEFTQTKEENFTDNLIETNEDTDDFFNEKENIEAFEENSTIDEVFSDILNEKEEAQEKQSELSLEDKKIEEIFQSKEEEKPQEQETKELNDMPQPSEELTQAPSEAEAEHKDEIIIKRAISSSYNNVDIRNADIIDPDEQFKDEKFDSPAYKDPYYIQREAKTSGTDIKSHEEIIKDVEDVSFSDEELDFFQMAKDSATEEDIKETSIEPIEEENISLNEEEVKKEDEEKIEEEKEEQTLPTEEKQENEAEVDLNEIANKSIDRSFEQIINEKNEENQKTISIDENTELNADILNQPAEKENLPIFKDEAPESKENSGFVYSVGDIILHKKYGRGEIVKTIKYEERQLLQISFEESGKKLLDPKVADIKLEQ